MANFALQGNAAVATWKLQAAIEGAASRGQLLGGQRPWLWRAPGALGNGERPADVLFDRSVVFVSEGR
jgi:hypothetical protein